MAGAGGTPADRHASVEDWGRDPSPTLALSPWLSFLASPRSAHGPASEGSHCFLDC